MARSGGLVHSKLPEGAEVTVRDTGALIGAEDREQFSPQFVAKGFLELREKLGEIARQIENKGYPVDEYNTCTLTGASSESTVSLLPTYELMPEKILAVLVCGPPAAACTVILGDRQWPIVIPAAGIIPIGPVALVLGRSDPRQLVSTTPGTFFLELMGFADQRFAA
jgi:hypothetical protein